jgi:hypothetical protein
MGHVRIIYMDWLQSREALKLQDCTWRKEKKREQEESGSYKQKANECEFTVQQANKYRLWPRQTWTVCWW